MIFPPKILVFQVQLSRHVVRSTLLPVVRRLLQFMTTSVLQTAAPETQFGFRTDVEGLRGAAVLLVLFYHARLPPCTGGFLGVDVFFVISGFVIYRVRLRFCCLLGNSYSFNLPVQLFLKHQHSGTPLSVAQFFAWRTLRLLPLSSFCLFSVMLIGRLTMSSLSLISLYTDVRMASVAWFNMHLAETSFEYAFQGVDPSPLLHFWSLAVEEQFYLLWPFILRALPSDSVKHTRNYRLRFMIVLWLLSFSLCISSVWSFSHRNFAFYSLPSRAWQLLTGTITAEISDRLFVAESQLKKAPWQRLLHQASTLGCVGILCSALLLTDQMNLLISLIPTFCTALVLLGPPSSFAHQVLSVPWLRWFGLRSYALYLAHWPVIFFVANANREHGVFQVTWQLGLISIFYSIIPSALLHAFVELRLRVSGWAQRRWFLIALSLVFCAYSIACISERSLRYELSGSHDVGNFESAEQRQHLLWRQKFIGKPRYQQAIKRYMSARADQSLKLCVSIHDQLNNSESIELLSSALENHCFDLDQHIDHPTPQQLDVAHQQRAAAALRLHSLQIERFASETVHVPADLKPSIADARNTNEQSYPGPCSWNDGSGMPIQFYPCDCGDTTSNTSLVLTGDSHALVYLEFFCELGKHHHLRIQFVGHNTNVFFTPLRRFSLDRIVSLRPTYIVIASSWIRRTSKSINSEWDWGENMFDYHSKLAAFSPRVMMFFDCYYTRPPNTPDSVFAYQYPGMPEMVSRCMHSFNSSCFRLRSEMNDKSWKQYAAAYTKTAKLYHWQTLDITDYLCGPTLCPYVIADRLVMWESNHLTRSVINYFAPILEDNLVANFLKPWPSISYHRNMTHSLQ